MSGLRILRFADVPDTRTQGLARVVHGTTDALRERGHHVDHVFQDAFRYSGPVKLRRFFCPMEVPGIVRRRFRERGPYDVVEIHEPIAAPYAWQRRRKGGLPPLVVFSHGLEERGHAATLAYRRQKGLRVSPKNRWSPLSIVVQARYAVRHAEQVVCSSSEDIAYLEAAGVPSSWLATHHNGVGPVFLEAGDAPDDRSRDGILFLGTWLVRKGVLDLVPAVSRVMERRPSLRFTAAGTMSEPARILTRFPPELRDRIEIVPLVDGDRSLIDLYRRHRIFVLPSFFEGQPLSMIEAASQSLAIVTTPVCGMADFVEDGVNGVLTPVGDPIALAGRLGELLDDPERMDRLGDGARRTATTHTWADASVGLEAAYRRAIVAGGPPRGKETVR